MTSNSAFPRRIVLAVSALCLVACLPSCRPVEAPLDDAARSGAARVPAAAGPAAAGPAAAGPAAARGNAAPRVIPALREWRGGQGTFRYGNGSRIIRSRAHAAALAGTSRTFAADLAALTGRKPAQLMGTARDLRRGDILLTLGSRDRTLGREGYTLRVTGHATVGARTDTGAFYGTRTLLQLLHQSRAVPRGTARDWPKFPERGLMVDNGRKFFAPRWLAAHIKELSYLKLNYLHLHLSDNEGFRVESTSHPEFVAADKLTKRQVKDLIALAARHKITVVPEFEAPGHMRAVLGQHTDLRLVSRTGEVHQDRIDLSKPGAYKLIREIYTEYLKLFPGPYFHIGADEYRADADAHPQILAYARKHYGPKANAKDTYLGFINWANRLVRAAGKTTRAWSDGVGGGSAVKVDPNVILEYWYTHGLTPQQHVDNGHRILNASWVPTYYILGGNKPDTVFGYEKWHPNLFQDGGTLRPASRSRNLGAKLHVWCDMPELQTEQQVAAGLREPLRMLAQQVWGSPRPARTWARYQPLINRIGRSPGWPRALKD
ncbi:family 20 glycosylhydrolase [Streptomyces sp. NBC_01304]|uniref:family 20 glycosylhydrolase n=1 Tax=Streptomyces sp. NBC_01304 TaxID=2903818 RepID=UPI002E133A8D|nr:family 20 glycosylhydrolase [Streptomyces sp. NBC_01304]